MPGYRMKTIRFCGEEKTVMQSAPAKDADPDLRLCSACETQPQVMHCGHVKRWTRPKHAREEVPVYCTAGLCEYHAPPEEERDMYRCRLHRPKKKARLL